MQRDVWSKIEKVGIVAAIREHLERDALVLAAEAVPDGGILIAEISLTVSERRSRRDGSHLPSEKETSTTNCRGGKRVRRNETVRSCSGCRSVSDK